MRTRVIIFCLFVLAIICLLLWYHPANRQETNSHKIETVITNQLLQNQGVKQSQASMSVAPPTASSPTQINTDARRKMLLEQIKNEWRTPIAFYGKVVDENTNPVVGAHISFDCNDLSPSGTSYYHTESDGKGLFSINDIQGLVLGVNVSKEGYYSYLPYGDNFFYAGKNQNFVPDANNPVVFYLRKKGVGTQLITSDYGMRPDFPIRISRDGQPVEVNLVQRQVGSSGDLEISHIEPNDWQQATNWSFHMSIPSGGFIGQDDVFPFDAPETGYQSTVDLNFVKDDPNWTTHVVTNYYIVFGQPQKYGWLRVEADIAQETVFLKYAINPTGSRNLKPP